jgi:dienelactone hydrolase
LAIIAGGIVDATTSEVVAGVHNDTTPRYDDAAAKAAWQRALDWFNKYLH